MQLDRSQIEETGDYDEGLFVRLDYAIGAKRERAIDAALAVAN